MHPKVVRRRPGAVRDAILAFLKAKSGDASLEDIIQGVRAALGDSVAASSVRSYLRLNVGTAFRRSGRGRYRLMG